MLAPVTWLLLASASTFGITYFYIVNFTRKRRAGEPDIVPGSLLMGSAKEFGQNAVELLHRCYKRHGDMFTIRLINQYLTVIMDPHSFTAMSKERNFDFDHIQRQVNWNVFGMVLKNSRKMIKDTGRTVRGPYLDRSMRSFTSNLEDAFDEVVPSSANLPKENDGWTTMGLRHFCAETIFRSLFVTIFGSGVHDRFNHKDVYENFEVFHRYFNYFWLGLPGFLFPDALKALEDLMSQPFSDDLASRSDCSEYIKAAVTFMRAQGQSEAEIKGHSLVYLHVNYNTFRLAFWVLSMVLERPEAFAALKEEVDSAIEDRTSAGTNNALFTLSDVEDLKILNSIVEESTRLSSGVFMIRHVVKDTYFTTHSGTEYLVREGDRVAIYPPALHKDPEVFEDPEEFKYDRFVDAKFYKAGKEVKHPVIAFGSLCPGKRFALLQLKWCIVRIVSQFDMFLLKGQKAEFDYQYYGHEILPAVADVDVSIRRRENAPRLEFARE